MSYTHSCAHTHTGADTSTHTIAEQAYTIHHCIFKMSTKIYNVLFAVLYQAIFIAIRGCMQPLARGSLS